MLWLNLYGNSQLFIPIYLGESANLPSA
jgi:hypothetical protein